MDPIYRFESEARRITTAITTPVAAVQAISHLTGINNDKITAPDFNALGFGRSVEIINGDAIAIGQAVFLFVARDIKQHAAANHFVGKFFDTVFMRTGRVNQRCIIAVPHLIAGKDMGQRIPLTGGLGWQIDKIIGIAETNRFILTARFGVGTGCHHMMQRIPTPAKQAVLWAVFIQVQTKPEYFAFFDQLGSFNNILWFDVIEHAQFIVPAPLSPI